MQRHGTDALGQASVMGDGHAPFAGGDRLVGIKGKARDGGGTFAALLPGLIGSPAPRGRESVRCILHHPEPADRREPLQVVDVHHETADVHRDHAHDRRPGGNGLGQLAGS